MKTAFVTGATGFLGTNIVKQLIEQGVEVHALKRQTSNTEEFDGLPVHWHIGDVTNRDSLMQACPDHVDAFFHGAADTSMWKRKDAQQTRINMTGTENAIAAALAKQATRFIHTSSIAAYGIHHETITEASAMRGEATVSNYYRTKQQSEELVKAAVKKQGLNAVILNPCHLVGAPDHNNWSQMISLIKTEKLPGIPPGLGSFCDIREVAKAHITAVEKGKTGENYILSGVDMSFVEFVGHIGALLGKTTPKKAVPSFVLKTLGQLSVLWANIDGQEPTITPEKALIVCDRLSVSSEKAQRELNYRADIDIRASLQSCYDWMQTRGLV